MARVGFKGNKFHAKKIEYDGYKFDSMKELKRYQELKMLERGKAIHHLKVHVPFELIPKNKEFRAVKYVADFVYYENETDFVVEDVKGCKIGSAYEVFKLKKKMFYHKYGIVIKET